MGDPGFNSLLKWGVENSEAARNGGDNASDSAAAPNPPRGFDQEALARLLGGPSDADRMREALAAVLSPDVELNDKLIAFDNFEQLIEGIDNANNMESMGLWTPMVDILDNPESELQLMASWCIATATQNNPKAQERCLIVGAIPKLVNLSLNGSTPALRRKAIFALSSEVRNYQPGLDELAKALPIEYRGVDKLDATDMDAVDVIINRLRESVQ